MIFWCLKNGFPGNNSYILLDGEKKNCFFWMNTYKDKILF